jgi:hypothetical protein
VPSSNGRARLPAALDVAAVLDTLAATSKGRVDTTITDSRLGAQLWALVGECESQSVGLADIALAGEFLAAGHLAFRGDLGSRWVAGPGNLLDVVAKARRWQDAGRPDPDQRSQRSRDVGVGDIVDRALALEAEGR